jgi:hypothetical protein
MTRGELLAAVWDRPVSAVAAELGISGAGLHKVCERYDLDTPDRGYWARVDAGKVEPQAPALRGKDIPVEFKTQSTHVPTARVRAGTPQASKIGRTPTPTPTRAPAPRPLPPVKQPSAPMPVTALTTTEDQQWELRLALEASEHWRRQQQVVSFLSCLAEAASALPRKAAEDVMRWTAQVRIGLERHDALSATLRRLTKE